MTAAEAMGARGRHGWLLVGGWVRSVPTYLLSLSRYRTVETRVERKNILKPARNAAGEDILY